MQESTYKHTVKSVLCCLRKAEGGKPWPRLTKDKAKVTGTGNNHELTAKLHCAAWMWAWWDSIASCAASEIKSASQESNVIWTWSGCSRTPAESESSALLTSGPVTGSVTENSHLKNTRQVVALSFSWCPSSIVGGWKQHSCFPGSKCRCIILWMFSWGSVDNKSLTLVLDSALRLWFNRLDNCTWFVNELRRKNTFQQLPNTGKVAISTFILITHSLSLNYLNLTALIALLVLDLCCFCVLFSPKVNWLKVDFGHWKEWEDDSDDDMSRFDKFSEVRVADTYSVCSCEYAEILVVLTFVVFSVLRWWTAWEEMIYLS